MDDDSSDSVDGNGVFDELTESLPEDIPFRDKLQDEYHPIDFLTLAIVPVVLGGVFQLPSETRWAFAFDYSDPTVVTAFTANYVHLTRPHLVSNIIQYCLLVLVTYLLALSNGNRSRFYTILAGILVVFPIPISYLNLAVPRPGVSVGFSGLNMVLFGFALVEISAYLNEHFLDQFGVENAPVFFFLITAFVATPHAGSPVALGIVVVSLLLAKMYSLGMVLSYQPSLSGVKAAIGRQGYFELLCVSALLLVTSVLIAFPQNPVTETGIINIYIHLVGLCLGFTVVFIWVLVTTPAEPEKAVLLYSFSD